jgi:DNA-binding Xre family transcriptional regulator
MVELRVRQMAEQRGITNIKALAEQAGLAYDTARDLWHGRMQRIDRTVLTRVCDTLQCVPGDVIVLENFEGITSEGNGKSVNNSSPLRLAA